MSFENFWDSKKIRDIGLSFDVIITAAIREAFAQNDDQNKNKLMQMWPEIFSDFKKRYVVPGGVLTKEDRDKFTAEVFKSQTPQPPR